MHAFPILTGWWQPVNFENARFSSLSIRKNQIPIAHFQFKRFMNDGEQQLAAKFMLEMIDFEQINEQINLPQAYPHLPMRLANDAGEMLSIAITGYRQITVQRYREKDGPPNIPRNIDPEALDHFVVYNGLFF